MSTENPYTLSEKWLPQINTDFKRIDDVFIRRSGVIQVGDSHSVQIALITPTGLNKHASEINIGHALPRAGYFGIRHLFENFGRPNNFDLALSVRIENVPKNGKERSGDMPAVVVLHERSKEGVQRFMILSILVDNLSTYSDQRYGIFKYKSDSYSSDCQRDSLINGSEKFILFARYFKESSDRILTGKYGPGFNNGVIPDSSKEFRNKVLSLFSDQLPDSLDYSEKSRGIYCVSIIDISHVPYCGFTGESIVLRSAADITAMINYNEGLDYDAHAPAQATLEKLNGTSFERYRAKLEAGIYDTTGPNYMDHIGGFEITKHNVFDGEGLYAATDEKYGHISHSVSIQSDGYDKGSEVDDVSKIQANISGYYFDK